MKKLALLLLVCSLLLSLAACAAAGTDVTGSKPGSGESPASAGAETAVPTQTAVQTEPDPAVDSTEELESESAAATAPADYEDPAETTEPVDLGGLSLAGTEWEAESIEDDRWVGRALDFYADGSLYYREGRMFSEYALYLDGLWRTEEDGTLDLTLWYSPYDAWDRPEDYRVSAADVPAESWTARFTCTPVKGDCLDLIRQTERGFADEEEERQIELHPAEDMPIISLQELQELTSRDDEELARLQESSQDSLGLFGYGGWTRFRGIAGSGDGFAAKVEYTLPLTISEAELAQAAETGRISLLGQEYIYTTSHEEAEQHGLSDSYSKYGSILRVQADGQISGGYWVLRAGDRYYFVYEIGGMSSRLETVEERCWLMLDPETPVVIGPGWQEDAPKTLGEYGTVPANALSTPTWGPDNDEFCVYIDLR